MKPKHSLTPETEKKDGEDKPCIDPDTSLLVQSFIGITFEAFKVVIACLLSLFVPQVCPGDPTAEGDAKNPHECTLKEQVRNLDGFALLVFIWNFITLGVFVVHYILVYKREAWMVEYLDEDDEFGDNNLTLNGHAHLMPYPGINNDLRKVNYRILITSIVGCVALSVNVVVSGIQVFRDYYGGFRTATTYITNVLLIVTILKTTISNAYAGIQHHLALSCIHFEPVSYNVVDRDHVKCCQNAAHTSAMVDCPRTGSAVNNPQAGGQLPSPPGSPNANTSLANGGGGGAAATPAPAAAAAAPAPAAGEHKAVEMSAVTVHVDKQ